MSQVVAEGVQSRGFSRITPLLGIGDLSVAVVCVCVRDGRIDNAVVGRRQPTVVRSQRGSRDRLGAL